MYVHVQCTVLSRAIQTNKQCTVSISRNKAACSKQSAKQEFPWTGSSVHVNTFMYVHVYMRYMYMTVCSVQSVNESVVVLG